MAKKKSEPKPPVVEQEATIVQAEPPPEPERKLTQEERQRAKLASEFLADLAAKPWLCHGCQSTEQPAWTVLGTTRRVMAEGRCPGCGERYRPSLAHQMVAIVQHADGLLVIQRCDERGVILGETHFALAAIGAIVWEPRVDHDYLRIVLLAGETWSYEVADASLAIEAFGTQARAITIGLGDYTSNGRAAR